MRALLFHCIFLLLGLQLTAQIYNPVSWSTEVKPLDNGSFDLLIKAKIDKGWHLYAQDLANADGPIATEISFVETAQYTLNGKVVEPKPMTEYDPNFDMDLNFFEHAVTFTQNISSSSQERYTLEGEVFFMVCDEEKCLPPEYVTLTFDIPASVTKAALNDNTINTKSTDYVSADIDIPEGLGLVEGSGSLEPVKWNFYSKKIEDGIFSLHFAARIDRGWHLYSQHLPTDDGPIATAFYFEEGVELIGQTEEKGDLITDFDPNFDMELNFYADKVEFIQKIKTDKEKISGELEYMCCDEMQCIFPDPISFEMDLSKGQGEDALDNENVKADLDISKVIPQLPLVNVEEPLGDCGERNEANNVWVVFLLGFVGGLIALLTPCVFPMIPLTVSFFTKGDGEGKGLGKAMLYGFFIFIIYALLSVPFHFNTDPEVLNEVATSVWLNLIFFIVFVVFAISFFGYFEITLPSSLTTKTDSATQLGGVVGIFFMALTLALVSFSCTGPILGTVLGNALKNGPWPISAAMSGFGVALGLPFAFFAAFPSLLNKLPKSGGWLNSVKVVLGFIELALALKFLSNADLVEQWGMIKRETFFLVWTIIGLGLFAYLIGWIKFPHDSPIQKLSFFRKSFAATVLIFTIYISTGVLKDPIWNHNALSGFPPPTFYGWYEKETFHAEFDDFNEAMAEARAVNKPLLIDFTGWACVNCRKMEESIWTVDEIKKRLEQDFVLVSLYVDDKIELPKEQQGIFEYMTAGGDVKKKKIKTIGNKWATFQTQVFNNNSQPYYVMLSPDGELLGNPVGYTPKVEDYANFLDCGLNTFQSNELSLN